MNPATTLGLRSAVVAGGHASYYSSPSICRQLGQTRGRRQQHFRGSIISHVGFPETGFPYMPKELQSLQYRGTPVALLFGSPPCTQWLHLAGTARLLPAASSAQTCSPPCRQGEFTGTRSSLLYKNLGVLQDFLRRHCCL